MTGIDNKIPATRTAVQLAAGLAAIALLQVVDLLSTSGWGLLFWLFILAIPLAVFSLELQLFTWRAVLKEATRDDSISRSLLWWGTLRKLLTFIGALFGAGLILVLTQDLHAYYWYVLYALAPALLLIYLSAKHHWLQGEVRNTHQPLFGRRFALVLVALLVTASFSYLAYYHVGVPDLRASTLEAVVSQAFQAKFQAAATPLIGALLGFIHAVSQGTWFLMQVTSGTLNGPFKLIAWLLFLIPSALQALLIVRLQLGLFAIVEHLPERPKDALKASGAQRLFLGTFFGLVILSTWLGYRVQTTDLQKAGETLTEAATHYDPCQAWSPELANFSYDEQREIEAIVASVQPLLNEHIKVKVNFSDKRMDRHIDNYLDWYFSQGNQFFMQLIYLRDRVDDGNRLTALINTNLRRYIWSPYSSSMRGANDSIADRANELLEAEFIALEKRMEDRKVFLSQYQGDICLAPALLSLDNMPELRHAMSGRVPAAAGATFVSGAIAAKMVSKKLAAALGTKTTAKIIAKMGLNLSTKAITAGTTVAAGASAGALCGPAAPACAIVGGIGAAVAFEMAFNEADEFLSRAEAKSDLKIGIHEMTKQAELAYLDAYDTILEDAVKRTFNPAYVPAHN